MKTIVTPNIHGEKILAIAADLAKLILQLTAITMLVLRRVEFCEDLVDLFFYGHAAIFSMNFSANSAPFLGSEASPQLIPEP